MLSGISGLAGVVNIIPREYNNPETSWEAEYGTFDTYRARLSHGGTAGSISYGLTMDSPYTDGPEDKHEAESLTNFSGNIIWQPTSKLSFRTRLFHIYGKREPTKAEPPGGV